MVKAGELANCEFINVESEFAALSVAIGASAAGVRTYTATSSQGLLFMAEAVYNAAGLGLPIVMTIGNRAIGAPINIWNDHSDSMSMRDAGWIQLYAETNQEALDLHIQAFRLAEELSCPVMVCMDGFILTHAYDRVDVPTQEQVDAFLPPLRAAADARSGRSGEHRRDGRARGVHRGALPLAPQAAARARPDPAARRGVQEAVRPRLGRPHPHLPHRGRRDDRRRARLGQRHDPGSRRRDARRAARGSARSRSARSGRSRSARCARRCSTRSASSCSRSASRSAWAASSPTACASRCRASCSTATPSSPDSAGARSRARRCARLFEDAERDELEQVTFLDLNADVVEPRARARERSRAAPARRPKRSCAASAPSPRASAEPHGDRRGRDRRSSSTRPARSPSATACSPRTSARCRRTCTARTRSTPGTAPARAAARRSARATRSTRRCARPATS